MMESEIDKVSLQLEDSHRKIRIIYAVSAELNKVLSLREKLHSILAILDTQFGLKHSMILLPDKKHEKLTIFASNGYDENLTGLDVRFGQGLVGLAALHKRKINITGIVRKRDYIRASNEEKGYVPEIIPGLKGAESQIAIPLLSNNELVAVLMAESTDFCVFSQEDEEFLVTLTQPMAVSILNSILYDSLEEKIKDRTAELEKLTETKEKIFSIISHDLRSPLASFQGLVKMFRYYNQRGDTARVDELCLKVDHSIHKLNHLVDNLLNWSLQHTNGIACHFETIQLKQFINEIAEIYKENIFSKSLSLEVMVDNSITIWGDRHTLATALRNLLSNAIKFTPHGKSISISAKTENSSAFIYLQDDGVGIVAEKLQSIFDIREQKVTPGTEKEKGTGLGLVLVKEFIQMNHGTITVTSRPGEGTCFTITLPSAA
jgi:signal transduction histidine kinase